MHTAINMVYGKQKLNKKVKAPLYEGALKIKLTNTNKSFIIILVKFMERQILHVDVNNAFLSWLAVNMLEKGSNIDIRTIPSIIGGDEEARKGIVLAKSMKAKECGIVTGEPIYQAKRKCPGLQIYRSDFKVFKKYSDELYNMLLEYTDKIERFSIDECFMDMTEYLIKDTLLNKAKEINKRVKSELGFTVNIGVAHNKLLAKMASDFTKPDRIHTLYNEEIPTKMWTLPISELFMIGRKTVPKLHNMGIKTIGDLAHTDRNLLIKKFGKQGNTMWEYSNGIDNSEVNYQYERPKCIGNEITLPEDICNISKLEEILLALAEQVSYRLRKSNLLANSVSVHLKTKEFINTSHQGKLELTTSNTKTIYKKAKQLLNEMYKAGTFIRLIGLRVDNLVETDEVQLSLFDNENKEKNEKLNSVIDELKDKYGYNSVTLAGKMNVGDYIKFKE